MIRRHVAEDVEQMLEVWHAASTVAHPFLDEDFLAEERRMIRDVFLPRADVWVYEHEGVVVGFISLLGDEIGGLFLHPGLHRGGIGTALVDHVARDRDALELEVFAENRMGRPFYEAYGFRPIRESVHEPSGQTEVRMRWERAPTQP